MTEDEQILNERTNELNIAYARLKDHDYRGRKVAFEVAAALKELNPEISLPNYEQYLEDEVEADRLRARINELTQAQ